jgi:hypothetical protein
MIRQVKARKSKAWKVKESEGVEHVFQVMINNVVIGKMPMEKKSTLFWIPFESHHIDLMWISSPWSWSLRRLEF